MKQNHFYKRHHGNKSGEYLIATLFIAAGLLLLGKNLGILEPCIYQIFMSWQMLLIILGVYTLFKREYLLGLIFLAAGSYFIAPKLGLAAITFMNFFWPVILIIIGLYFILHISRKRKKKRITNEEEFQTYESKDGYIHSENMFGAIKHIVADEMFKGGEIKVKFGGTIIDLRRSTLESEYTYLDVECKFSGIELYLPAHWNVKIETSNFLAGCEDNRLPVPVMDTEHTLIIRGTLSLSGIEIKS